MTSVPNVKWDFEDMTRMDLRAVTDLEQRMRPLWAQSAGLWEHRLRPSECASSLIPVGVSGLGPANGPLQQETPCLPCELRKPGLTREKRDFSLDP